MRSREILQTIIENSTGQYKVGVEKRFCHNEYRFYAKQISINVNGEHYHIDSMLDRFRFVEYGPVEVYPVTPNISEYEIQLNRFKYWYTGEITGVKRHLRKFCSDINRNAKNEIKRVS